MRPSLLDPAPKIRDVWVGLDFATPVGIHRVRFYPRNTVESAPFYPFQNDYLRAYELWVNPTETDANTPDILVQRSAANERPIVDVPVSPQYVRQLKLRSLTAVPFELDEIEVYGTGYMRQGTYLSDIIDLGDYASIGPLRWIADTVGDSLFSKMSVRMRTGHDDTPWMYQQWLRDSQGRITGPTDVTPRQYYALERRDRVALNGIVCCAAAYSRERLIFECFTDHCGGHAHRHADGHGHQLGERACDDRPAAAGVHQE